MPSFDIVSKVDIQEVKNALNYVDKEIATRYDLKGTKAGVVFDEKLLTITLTATDKLQLAAVNELMTQKLAKRGVTVKSLEYKDAESASGDSLRQVVNLKQGIKQEDAKRINQKIKANCDENPKKCLVVDNDELAKYVSDHFAVKMAGLVGVERIDYAKTHITRDGIHPRTDSYAVIADFLDQKIRESKLECK